MTAADALTLSILASLPRTPPPPVITTADVVIIAEQDPEPVTEGTR